MNLLKAILIPGCFAFNIAAAKTIYVKPAGSDANTGGFWNQAFKTLQQAIATAVSGDQVWLAKGTYYPDEGNGAINNDRAAAFHIKNGITIYGGFAGTETTEAQRNWKTNITILSGEIQQDADNTNNAYHVLVSTGVNANTTVDGLLVTAGNAGGTGSDRSGGGWFNDGSGIGNSSVPAIRNCTFSGNLAADFGGAIFNNGWQGSAAPAIFNCSFIDNKASVSGGAIFNYGQYGNASPAISNCSFTNNSSGQGGAVYNSGYQGISNASFINCCFSNNSSTNYGGAMVNDGEEGICTVSMVNCSYGKNAALYGGALMNIGTNGTCTPAIYNSIFWDDATGEIFNNDAIPVISYSIVQGGYTGVGNTGNDPFFVNAASGDLHVQSCSPAIDAGSNAIVTATTDLDGNARIVRSIVDIGAYEFQEALNNVVYVNPLAAGENNGRSWANAFTSLQNALSFATGCKQVKQIWVAKGTYYPDEGNRWTNNDRNAFFMLVKGVAIYGGFGGTESLLAQRNPGLNATILSGEIQQDNDTSNNAYHVIRSEYVDSFTIVDGFTITAGHAGGPDGGPGLSNWLGGGWLNDGTGSGNFSNPTIVNCDFISNTAALAGGAIYNAGFGNGAANPAIINCRFMQNASKGKLDGGGAIYNDATDFGTASPAVSNCIFTGNSAVNLGGGIFNMASGGMSDLVITNCSFNGNTANEGGALANYSGNTVVSNCIFWGNGSSEIFNQDVASAISNSIVKGGYAGTGNMDKDPLFADADLHLQACSPAIDAGNNSTVAGTIDLDSHPRIVNGKVDIGAYELQTGACCPAGNVIYVNKLATGQNNGSSWADAFNFLQDALAKAASCGNVTQVWVAKGTYFTDEGSGLTDNDRNLSFKLKNGIGLFGGFVGTETSLLQRNGKTNPTILSGEIQQDNLKTNNAYIVVKADPSVNTILDGFTITGGN